MCADEDVIDAAAVTLVLHDPISRADLQLPALPLRYLFR
jgi:hypothetical protein